MNTTFQATNLELTDELRSFTEKKLEDCYRTLGSMDLDPVQIAVELERTAHRNEEQAYRAEANVSLPGRMIRVEETGPGIRRAVVRMKRTLMRDLRKWREKLIDDRRKGARSAQALSPEEEAGPDPAPGYEAWEDIGEEDLDEGDWGEEEK